MYVVRSQRSLAGNAIERPGEHKADYDNEESYQPIRYELGKDECPFWYWGDINLLYGTGFFLANDIQRGKETAHQHHHHSKKSRYHKHLVIKILVVKEQR